MGIILINQAGRSDLFSKNKVQQGSFIENNVESLCIHHFGFPTPFCKWGKVSPLIPYHHWAFWTLMIL